MILLLVLTTFAIEPMFSADRRAERSMKSIEERRDGFNAVLRIVTQELAEEKAMPANVKARGTQALGREVKILTEWIEHPDGFPDGASLQFAEDTVEYMRETAA